MIGEDTEIPHSDDDYQPLPFVNQIVACVDRNSTLKKTNHLFGHGGKAEN